MESRVGTRAGRKIKPAQWRRAVIAIAAGDDPNGTSRDLLRAQPTVVWDAMDAAIVDVLAKVKGPQVAALVDILEGHGHVEAARRQLRSLSAVRRAAAVRRLGLMRVGGETARVAHALTDPSIIVASEAAAALGRLSAAEYVPQLLASALGREPVFRRSGAGVAIEVVASAIAAIGPDAVGAVRSALVGRDGALAAVAAEVVARASLTQLVPTVRGLLLIENRPEVLVALAGALGQLGGRRDARHLIRVAKSELPEIARIAAIEALATLRDPTFCAELGDLMASPSRRVSTSAASALAALGEPGIDELERHALRSGPSSAVAAYSLSVRGVRRSNA